jgi:hypothetical protein
LIRHPLRDSWVNKAARHRRTHNIRVIRVIRGETILAFPRKVFGKRDRRATDPRANRA